MVNKKAKNYLYEQNQNVISKKPSLRTGAFLAVMALCLGSLSACVTTSERTQDEENDRAYMSMTTPEQAGEVREPWRTPNRRNNEYRMAAQYGFVSSEWDAPTSTALSNEGVAFNCRMHHRFDRDGMLAYRFGDNNRNRLSLHVGLDGPDLGNPLNMDVEDAALRYTRKLGNYQNRRGSCLYPSKVQGLIGSIYNELYQREGKNAFEMGIDKLEERDLDFWR